MDAEAAYEEIVERGGRVSDAMRAFRTFLGHSDMMAYLAMMAPRLIELHRVLKETGIDLPTLRPDREPLPEDADGCSFWTSALSRNEIIWKRYGAHNDQGQAFTRDTSDVCMTSILVFRLGRSCQKWNQALSQPLDEKYVESTLSWSRRRVPDWTIHVQHQATGPEWHTETETQCHIRVERPSLKRLALDSKETMEKAGRRRATPLLHRIRGYVRSETAILDEIEGDCSVQDQYWTDIPVVNSRGTHRTARISNARSQRPFWNESSSASSNEGDVSPRSLLRVRYSNLEVAQQPQPSAGSASTSRTSPSV